LALGQHALVEDAKDKDAIGAPTVKDDVLAVLHLTKAWLFGVPASAKFWHLSEG
jgi:hypothetical protein